MDKKVKTLTPCCMRLDLKGHFVKHNGDPMTAMPSGGGMGQESKTLTQGHTPHKFPDGGNFWQTKAPNNLMDPVIFSD